MIELKGINPKMIANNLEPYNPTHPGEIIKEEIEYRGISQKKLANAMNISYTLLNEVLNGKRSLNTELALLIEVALDIPAEPLLQMQAHYNMLIAKHDIGLLEKLKKVNKVASML